MSNHNENYPIGEEPAGELPIPDERRMRFVEPELQSASNLLLELIEQKIKCGEELIKIKAKGRSPREHMHHPSLQQTFRKIIDQLQELVEEKPCTKKQMKLKLKETVKEVMQLRDELVIPY